MSVSSFRRRMAILIVSIPLLLVAVVVAVVPVFAMSPSQHRDAGIQLGRKSDPGIESPERAEEPTVPFTG
jgi:hypothetical protein